MAFWKFKSCPRCGGDVFLDQDMESWYEQCLQCSYSHELKSIANFKEQPAEKRKETSVAGGTRINRRSVSGAQGSAA